MTFSFHNFWKKYYLLVWLSALLITGFLGTSIASYMVSRNQVKASIVDDNLPLTSDNIYSEIQKYILRPTFIASLMANDTFLRDWALAGEQDLPAIVRYLHHIKTKYNTITSFLVSNVTRNYYYAGGLLKQIREGDKRDEWFFRVKGMKENHEISMDPDMSNRDVPTIFVNYKMFDYDGNLLAITGVGLTLDTITEMINGIEERFNRSIYFLDSTGTIAATGKRTLWTEGSIRELEGISKVAEEILTEDKNPIKLEYEIRGHQVMLNARYIPELSWYLIVEQDETAISQPLRHIFIINLCISAAITLLILLLVLFSVTRFQRKLEKSATTDSLTGIMNRQALEQVFTDELLQERKRPLSIVLFDIDAFKHVNDNYGHLAGDKVIQTIASFVQEIIEHNDIVCRWGGDEFLVLLQNRTTEQALQVAEDLRKQVEEYEFTVDQHAFHVTISIGISEHSKGESLTTLFAHADRALYRAKTEGRNRSIVRS